MEPKLIPPAPMMTTLKFCPGAGGGCLSMANSMSSVERRRMGFFPGGMVFVGPLERLTFLRYGRKVSGLSTSFG